MTDFKDFVAGLGATAAVTLQQVEQVLEQDASDAEPPAESEGGETGPPPAEQVRNGLSNARQLIDIITMLEQKTQGNLTDEERQVVQNTLTQLRVTYVRISEQAGKQP